MLIQDRCFRFREPPFHPRQGLDFGAFFAQPHDGEPGWLLLQIRGSLKLWFPLIPRNSATLELYCKMNSLMSQALNFKDSGFSKEDWNLLKKLDTPEKIQDFLNSLPFNFEEDGETHASVSEVLRSGKAHCFEGALLAAAALWIQGRRPLLLDLKTIRPDFDHVVALFEEDDHWGAISKTNHSVLRYRDPIYRSVRELAMSFFHEYFLANGKKSLRRYSEPYDLSKEKMNWLTGTKNLAPLAHKLDRFKHHNFITPKQIRGLRRAEKIEVEASGLDEWVKGDKRDKKGKSKKNF